VVSSYYHSYNSTCRVNKRDKLSPTITRRFLRVRVNKRDKLSHTITRRFLRVRVNKRDKLSPTITRRFLRVRVMLSLVPPPLRGDTTNYCGLKPYDKTEDSKNAKDYDHERVGVFCKWILDRGGRGIVAQYNGP
jgi:hypothetical protein